MKSLAAKMSRSMWKWLPFLLTFFVIGVLAYYVYINWYEVSSFPWEVKPAYIILVLLFHSVSLGATFIVWHLMVYRLSGFHYLRLSLRFYYTTTLAKRIPTSIPYIGSRLVVYNQVDVSSAIIMNCIVLELVLIGIAGLIAFTLFLPFYSYVPTGIAPLLILTAAIFLGVLFLRPRIFITFTNWVLVKLKKAELVVELSRQDIFVWIALYILPWIFAGLSFYCAPLAFSNYDGLDLITAIEISTLSTLISLLNFVLPGGLSLKEITSSSLLSPWIPLSAAIIISFGYRLLHTINEIIWAVITLLIPIPKEIQEELSSSSKQP